MLSFLPTHRNGETELLAKFLGIKGVLTLSSVNGESFVVIWGLRLAPYGKLCRNRKKIQPRACESMRKKRHYIKKKNQPALAPLSHALHIEKLFVSFSWPPRPGKR